MHTSQLASHRAITACSFLQEHISFTVYTYLHLQSLSVHGPEIIQIEKSILLPSTDDCFPACLEAGFWNLQTPKDVERSHNQNICSKEYFSERDILKMH